jgi:hypothetical protein
MNPVLPVALETLRNREVNRRWKEGPPSLPINQNTIYFWE